MFVLGRGEDTRLGGLKLTDMKDATGHELPKDGVSVCVG